MSDTKYLSKQKAARRLDVSAKTIDRLRGRGELEWIHVGSRVRIETASLGAYEQRQREQRAPRPAKDDFDALFPIGALGEIHAHKALRRAAGRRAAAAASVCGEAA